MRLGLTHFPVNPLIEQPEPSRSERVLTAGLHEQVLLANAVARDLYQRSLVGSGSGVRQGVGCFGSFDL